MRLVSREKAKEEMRMLYRIKDPSWNEVEQYIKHRPSRFSMTVEDRRAIREHVPGEASLVWRKPIITKKEI